MQTWETSPSHLLVPTSQLGAIRMHGLQSALPAPLYHTGTLPTTLQHRYTCHYLTPPHTLCYKSGFDKPRPIHNDAYSECSKLNSLTLSYEISRKESVM